MHLDTSTLFQICHTNNCILQNDRNIYQLLSTPNFCELPPKTQIILIQLLLKVSKTAAWHTNIILDIIYATNKERIMKKILLLVIATCGIIGIANAECRSTVSYGQYKQVCDNSGASSENRSAEFTEIPYVANERISKERSSKTKLASLEKSVSQADTQDSLFKPTHTQLDQVKQLLEYANSQGCTWGGKYDKPQLICP